jgi:hypothetical protein
LIPLHSIPLANKSFLVLLFSFQGEANEAAQLLGTRLGGSWDKEDHSPIPTNQAIAGQSFTQVFNQLRAQTDQQGGVQYTNDHHFQGPDDLDSTEDEQEDFDNIENLDPNTMPGNRHTTTETRKQAAEIRKLEQALDKELGENLALKENVKSLEGNIKSLKAKMAELTQQFGTVAKGKRVKREDLPREELDKVKEVAKSDLWRRVKFIISDKQEARNALEVIKAAGLVPEDQWKTPKGKKNWMCVPKFAQMPINISSFWTLISYQVRKN